MKKSVFYAILAIFLAVGFASGADASMYQYVNVNGTLSTIEAANDTLALKASDIAPHSGVILVSKTITASATTPVVVLPSKSVLLGKGIVMVMNHICKDEINSREDFDTLPSFVDKVLACPTVILPKDSFNEGAVAGDKIDFDFKLTESGGATQTISSSTFEPTKICESDLKMDVTGDGVINPATCIDTSHYVFKDVALGEVKIEEIVVPVDTRFGALEFTPATLRANVDASTFVSVGAEGNGVIVIDTSKDDDANVMLHIYNFMN